MLYTEKHELMIPEQDDTYNIDYVKHNMSIIDQKLGEQWQSSVTEFSEDESSVRTTYADGTYIITTISDTEDTITIEHFDENGTLTQKRITTIEGDTITEREVAV